MGKKGFATAMRWLPVLLIFITVLSGCTGARGLVKRGVQLEDAGLYTEAANFYFNALLRDRSNVDARIGLTNTSSRVFNDKLDAFSRHRAMEEHRQAVESYSEAMDYQEKVKRVGIDLDVASHYAEDFEYSKNEHLRALYTEANDMMAERRFDEAKMKFREVLRLDPNYKDVSELKGIAVNEPLYISATEHFDAGRYRKAYYDLDKIYSNDQDYRDAAVLRGEALELGRYPVALTPFDNATGIRGIEKRVYAYFLTSLSQLDDPFLKIVERDNMEMILDEQRLSLSGIVDKSTASRVGNLLGAKALLTATVLNYKESPGRTKVSEKDGFVSYTVKLYNATTERNYFETRYKPVKYNEYYQRNELRMSVQYKAISLESGELLFSQIVERTEEDQMYYAAFNGEVNNLLPAGPQGVLTSNRDRTRLQNLVRAPRTIRSVDDLTNAAFQSAADQLSQDLSTFLNKQ
jgi:tetratricopeptide (TPR) repeat protein